MPKSRIPLAPILLEAFFVVLGVVLALGANEWRQSVAESRRAETAREGILSEFAANRAAVHASVTYHLALTDSLTAMFARPTRGATPQDRARVFSRGFVSPASLLSTAWEVANGTASVNHMDYEEVVAFATMYQHQDEYSKQAQHVSQLLYQALFRDGLDGVTGNAENLMSIIGTFWFRECQLLRQYDALLEQGGASPDDAARPVPVRCTYLPQQG